MGNDSTNASDPTGLDSIIKKPSPLGRGLEELYYSENNWWTVGISDWSPFYIGTLRPDGRVYFSGYSVPYAKLDDRVHSFGTPGSREAWKEWYKENGLTQTQLETMKKEELQGGFWTVPRQATKEDFDQGALQIEKLAKIVRDDVATAGLGAMAVRAVKITPGQSMTKLQGVMSRENAVRAVKDLQDVSAGTRTAAREIAEAASPISKTVYEAPKLLPSGKWAPGHYHPLNADGTRMAVHIFHD